MRRSRTISATALFWVETTEPSTRLLYLATPHKLTHTDQNKCLREPKQDAGHETPKPGCCGVIVETFQARNKCRKLTYRRQHQREDQRHKQGGAQRFHTLDKTRDGANPFRFHDTDICIMGKRPTAF